MPDPFDSIDTLQHALGRERYFADRAIATTIFLGQRLGKPLFLEGEAGVGKTEIAKVLARILDTRLIRLQCYEGLDASHALYEWNYPKQLLRIRMEDGRGQADDLGREIFSEDYLIRRPLLDAITPNGAAAPVLLIDEIDRADEEFEAFLLEVLSDFQVTIPELGTIRAVHPPFVVLTSNRTREINDALKRRCLYLWVPYPDFERELAILGAKVPDLDERLARQICGFMQVVRERDFYKRPGVAESIDWARALVALHRDALDPAVVEETLGAIFKYNDDIEAARAAGIPSLLSLAEAAL